MSQQDAMLAGAAALTSYLAGSIPFGLIIGWLVAGVDIRKIGSGNIGATNAARAVGGGRRALGAAVFAAVFVLDVMKGAGPVLAWGQAGAAESRAAMQIAAAAGAVAGHMFSVFLRFRGGKGVAIGCGVTAALVPLPTAAAAGVFLVVFACTRIVSLGSIMAAASLPAFLAAFEGPEAFGSMLHLFLFACVVALAVIARHHANIGRLLRGTEHRFGGRGAGNGGRTA